MSASARRRSSEIFSRARWIELCDGEPRRSESGPRMCWREDLASNSPRKVNPSKGISSKRMLTSGFTAKQLARKAAGAVDVDPLSLSPPKLKESWA